MANSERNNEDSTKIKKPVKKGDIRTKIMWGGNFERSEVADSNGETHFEEKGHHTILGLVMQEIDNMAKYYSTELRCREVEKEDRAILAKRIKNIKKEQPLNELDADKYLQRLKSLWDLQNKIRIRKVKKWTSVEALRTSNPDCTLYQRYATESKFNRFLVSQNGNYFFFNSNISQTEIENLYRNPASIVDIVDEIHETELPFIVDVLRNSIESRLKFKSIKGDFAERFAYKVNEVIGKYFKYNENLATENVESPADYIGNGFVISKNGMSSGEEYLFNLQAAEESRRFEEIKKFLKSRRFVYSNEFTSTYHSPNYSKRVHRDLLPEVSTTQVGSARYGEIFKEFCTEYFRETELAREVKFDLKSQLPNKRKEEFFSSMCELAKSPAKIAYYIPVIGMTKDSTSKDYLGFLINIVRSELYLRYKDHQIGEKEIREFTWAVNDMLETYFDYKPPYLTYNNEDTYKNFDEKLWSKYASESGAGMDKMGEIISSIGRNFTRWNYNTALELVEYRSRDLDKSDNLKSMYQF